MKKVLYRNAKDFKNKGGNMILKSDAPIIRELIIYALKDDKDDPIVKWFNGKIDTSDPAKAYIIFQPLNELIRRLGFRGEIDDVTLSEWLKALACSINYNTALNRVNLSREFDTFINCTLGLDRDIDLGSIIFSFPGSYRTQISVVNQCDIDMENKTLIDNLKNVTCQNDYLSILGEVIKIMNEHAKVSCIEKIKLYAEGKRLFDLKKADEVIDTESFASEYVIWFQNIYKFLHNNPDILKEIEKDTKTNNLLDFFKMDDR